MYFFSHLLHHLLIPSNFSLRNKAKFNIPTVGICDPQCIQEPQRNVHPSCCLIIQSSVDLHGKLINLMIIIILNLSITYPLIVMLLLWEKFSTAWTQIQDSELYVILISVQL